MDVDAALEQLYGVPPDRFIALRAELAAQAKRDGEPEARASVAALRRPSTAAWALNRLVRELPEQIEDLLGIATALRAAQRALDAARMRELSTDARSAIGALGSAARELAERAGRPISDPVLRDVQDTLQAAVADESAEAALRSGRLTTALHYNGFGEVDISEAVAAAEARPLLSVVQPPRRTAASRPARGPEAGAAAVAPERRERQREDEARGRQREQLAQELAEAISHRDAVLSEAEQLRRRLQDLDGELRAAQAAVRSARRRVDALTRRT